MSTKRLIKQIFFFSSCNKTREYENIERSVATFVRVLGMEGEGMTRGLENENTI